MKKIMAVGLALILMTACSAEETVKEEKPAEQTKEQSEEQPAIEEEDNTPAPEPSVDYDKTVAGMLGGLSTTMTEFSQTLVDGSTDPLLMISAEYQQDLRDICDRLFADIQEFKSLDVPAERREMHDRLLDALSHYETVAIDTPVAVENLDANRLTELTGDMTAGNDKLVGLTNDLSEMMQ
jgi:hypothetical protein